MKYKKESDDERPFNMAILFLERLDRRQEEAQLYKKDADLYGWYRTLENIYDMVEFSIHLYNDTEADAELLLLFDKARIKLNNLRQKLDVNVQEITISDLNNLLRKIYRRINRLLYKYEMLIPHKAKRMTIDQRIDANFK